MDDDPGYSGRNPVDPGEERLCWLRELPRVKTFAPLAIVSRQPAELLAGPASGLPDAEIRSVYSELGQPIVVHGHTHYPAIRELAGLPRLLIDTGSVGLPYDGDPRASYLLLDGRVHRSGGFRTTSREKSVNLSACVCQARSGRRGHFARLHRRCHKLSWEARRWRFG